MTVRPTKPKPSTLEERRMAKLTAALRAEIARQNRQERDRLKRIAKAGEGGRDG